MNRRSFLRGLLALPLIPLIAPLAAKVVQRVEPWVPWMGTSWVRSGTWKASSSSYLGGGKFPIGTIDKYEAGPSSMYDTAQGFTLRVGDGIKVKYIRTGVWTPTEIDRYSTSLNVQTYSEIGGIGSEAFAAEA